LPSRGPNWIHGTIGNPILEIAKEADSVWSEDFHSTARVLDGLGSYLPQKLGDELLTIVWTLCEEGIELSAEHFAHIGRGETIYDYFTKRVMEEVDDAEKRKYLSQMVEQLGGIVAGDNR